MQAQRITTMLQGVADLRHWVQDAIPLTETTVGYDLFLKIGQEYFSGHALHLDRIAATLPYPPDLVCAQFERMKGRGLIEQATPGAGAFAPTQLFLDMLAEYRLKFESLFIVRKNIRNDQLLNRAGDAALRTLADTIYDRFYDLGWVHSHALGSTCFLMATTLARAVRTHGHEARVIFGYVEVLRAPNHRFLLGGRGFASPGQTDGHAMCLVDERTVFDFGLGNARRYFRRDFPWAMVADVRRDGCVLASLNTREGETVAWKDDWQTPQGADQIQRCEAEAEHLLAQYVEPAY
jgi:hypothetical protein